MQVKSQITPWNIREIIPFLSFSAFEDTFLKLKQLETERSSPVPTERPNVNINIQVTDLHSPAPVLDPVQILLKSVPLALLCLQWVSDTGG